MSVHKFKQRNGAARYITLKCKKHNIVTYVDDQDRIATDPTRASEYALRRHQKSFGIRYEQELFTIASYPQGHYLVYDHSEVVAYTVIMPDCQ